MTSSDRTTTPRIGRPPKVDRNGTPTRERLLRAAADACVDFGYEGATLADIARRAEVSTPAIYSHFSGKAELLVEACQQELNTISSSRLREVDGLRELARDWIQPDFRRSRIIVAEIHCAAIRQPDVAALLEDWQRSTTDALEARAGLTSAQAQQFFLLLIGLAHLDQVRGTDVSDAATEAELSRFLVGWLGERSLRR